MGNYKVTKEEWTADYNAVQRSLTDKKAWEELYSKVYPKVRNFVYKRVRPDHLVICTADEIVASAFERCYLHRAEFHGYCFFSTWVCAFCKNDLRSALTKSLRYQKRIDSLTDYSEYCDLTSDPYSFAVLRHRNRCIWMAYDSLDNAHKILIRWKIFGEIGASEASEKTGFSANQINYHFHKAIKILKQSFLEFYYNKKIKNTDDYSYNDFK